MTMYDYIYGMGDILAGAHTERAFHTGNVLLITGTILVLAAVAGVSIYLIKKNK